MSTLYVSTIYKGLRESFPEPNSIGLVPIGRAEAYEIPANESRSQELQKSIDMVLQEAAYYELDFGGRTVILKRYTDDNGHRIRSILIPGKVTANSCQGHALSLITTPAGITYGEKHTFVKRVSHNVKARGDIMPLDNDDYSLFHFISQKIMTHQQVA